MFTTIIAGNVIAKSTLRTVKVDGRDTSVIDLKIRARNGGEKEHQVKVVVWGNDAKAVAEHLTVGRSVSVQGTPKSNHWFDQEGKLHTWVEVHTQYVEFLNYGRGSDPKAE